MRSTLAAGVCAAFGLSIVNPALGAPPEAPQASPLSPTSPAADANGAPPLPYAPGFQPLPGPAAGLSPASDVAIVQIDATDDILLETQQNGDWVPVCFAPCQKAVRLDGIYRINGSGVRTSQPFRLERGATRLLVEPSSSAAHAFSIVITVVGVAGAVPALGVTSILVVGMLFGAVLICPIVDGVSKTSYGGCLGDIGGFFGNWYTYPGVWIPGVAGGLLVTGGAIGLASTPRTSVTAVPNAVARTRAPSLAGARAPEWHTDPLAAFGVRQTTVPLVRYTF